jgi:hypothetical protein
MMNDMKKTGIFVGAAALLVIVAMLTAPKQATPEAFFDEGEMFFPDFENPNDARTLEVIQFDATQGAAVPFKVTFEGGRWTIPSHHGYPADGADRLAQTAAGLIGITKDDFRTDNPSDYAACGVIDPLDDANPSMAGRGVRVTIKGENELVLADIIIGKGFEDREGARLVRLPNQKRVYGTRLDLELSTQFKDWIEPDLMFIEKDEVTNVVLKDYSIEETTGSLDERDEVMLARIGENWAMASMPEDRELDTYKLNNLVQAVDELTIEGIRPKPEGLSAMLSATEGQMQITQQDMLSLQSKGFYFTREGQLVSNEGEVQVHTADGVVYTLRFGEVVVGSGTAISAGIGEDGGAGGGQGENRYVMITTSFDPTQFDEPALPPSTDFETKPDSLWTEADYTNKGLQTEWDRWKQKVEAGQERSRELNGRFARWYYVISSESFEKLHLRRDDLLRDKPEQS